MPPLTVVAAEKPVLSPESVVVPEDAVIAPEPAKPTDTVPPEA